MGEPSDPSEQLILTRDVIDSATFSQPQRVSLHQPVMSTERPTPRIPDPTDADDDFSESGSSDEYTDDSEEYSLPSFKIHPTSS